MSKKVLVLSSSLRKDSNSEILADSLLRGAAKHPAAERAYQMGKQI